MPKLFIILCLLFGSLISTGHANKCTRLHVNGANSWLPMAYRDSQENFNGIAKSIIQKIAKELRIQVTFGKKENWSDLFIQLEKGEIDMLAGAYHTTKRAQKFIYSAPFFENQARIFIRKEHPFSVTKLDDLMGRVGVRPKGGSFGEKFDRFDKEHLNMKQVDTDKENPLMNWLMKDKADYVIADILDGRLAIKQNNLGKHITPLPYKVSITPVHLLISKKSPCAQFVDEINRQILEMKNNGSIQTLVEKELSLLIR